MAANFEISDLQREALERMHAWIDAGFDPQWPTFYLGGYAGSGKTSIMKLLAEYVNGRVEYAAFTGKAAHVLQRKGCNGARTVHSLIYRQGGDPPSPSFIEALEKELDEARAANDAERVQRLHERVEECKRWAEHRGPRFSLRPDSELALAKLCGLDECSMIDRKMGRDLESFGVPIIACGDPAQLPPVMGAGYFTNREPDFLLDEVHRQAADSPILQFATAVRQGRRWSYGEHGPNGELVVIPWDSKEKERYAMAADQMIVGRNNTRHGTNAKYRRVKGLLDQRADGLPVPGDRVICTRNNYETGVVNGSMWEVVHCDGDPTRDTLDLEVKSLEGRGTVRTQVWTDPFLGRPLPNFGADDYDQFAYGYAITCHKSQGSEYDSVVVFDESGAFKGQEQRWLYTAVTRAAKRLVVVM